MIRGSDGLDYEDLNARLLGEPAETGRNNILRPDSPPSRLFKEAFRETYDHCEEQGYPPLECYRSAYAHACITAGSTNKFLDDRTDALLYSAILYNALIGSSLPEYTKPESFGTITLYSGEPPASGPSGAGGSNPVQTAFATFCAAPEPTVRRRLGP